MGERVAGDSGPTASRDARIARRTKANSESVRLSEGGIRCGKDVLARLIAHGGDPAAIVAARGLGQVADHGELGATVAEVLGKHAGKVAEYRAGKVGLLGFFVGQVMKAAGGRASPAAVNELVAKALAS